MKTKHKLARDLRQAGAPSDMVSKATQGYYDDYESDLTFPLTQLIKDCEKVGLAQIAHGARSGKYDGTKAEANEWMTRGEGL